MKTQDQVYDLLDEDRLTLTKLAQEEDRNVSTVWRWANRGVKGVALETYSVAGRRYTTRQAFKRFVRGTTDAATGAKPKRRTNRQRASSIKQAEAELAKAGF